MQTGLTVMFVVDGVLTVIGLALVASPWVRSHRGVPVSVALVLCFSALLAHVQAYRYMVALAVQESGSLGPGTQLFLFLANMAIGAAPAAVFGGLLTTAWSNAAANFLFGTRPPAIPDEVYIIANKCVAANDIDGALEEYRRIARLYPKEPDPLLAAASILESAQRYEEAEAWWREVMRVFEDDNDAWIPAALRIAAMCRDVLDRPGDAMQLEREVAARRAAPARYERRMTSAPKRAGLGHLHEARRGIARKETKAALKEYQKSYADKPQSPRPLFEAATALERTQRNQEAADVLRDIIQKFRANDAVWGEAAYRLANLLENHLEEPGVATHLLREIVKRMPRTELGHLAVARLTQQNKGS